MSGKRAERRTNKMRTIVGNLCTRNLSRKTFSVDALAAIERYPVLASIPSSQYVLTCASTLDTLPDNLRPFALERFALHDSDVLTALAKVPPMLGRDARLRKDGKLAELVKIVERQRLTTD